MPFRGERTDNFFENCTGKLLVARGKLYFDNTRAQRARVREVDRLYPLAEPETSCLSLIEHFDN